MPSIVMRLFPVLVLPIVAVLLSSCQTVSRSECQVGDWFALGERDGRAGEPASLIEKHAEGCSRFSLPVDSVAWEAGRQRGLQAYCTPPSAWQEGVDGRPYRNVCTGPAGGDFTTAYALGQEVRAARESARRADGDLDRIERELRHVEDDIRDVRRRIASATDDERRRLMERLRDLEDRRFDLRSDAFDVRRDARRAADEAAVAERRALSTYIRIFGAFPS